MTRADRALKLSIRSMLCAATLLLATTLLLPTPDASAVPIFSCQEYICATVPLSHPVVLGYGADCPSADNDAISQAWAGMDCSPDGCCSAWVEIVHGCHSTYPGPYRTDARLKFKLRGCLN